MATIITEECINCGACEPECPNTAIYQGGVEFDDIAGAKQAALHDEVFYIVPEKCTECVGFFDYEACAAVCPVDCCVTDPNNEESEAVLVARAKQLHPDTDFGDSPPSRFSPDAGSAPAGDGEPAAAAAAPAGGAVAAAAPVAAGAAGVVATGRVERAVVRATRAPASGSITLPAQTELDTPFEDVLSHVKRRDSVGASRGIVGLGLLALMPGLGALPHKTKQAIEDAYGDRRFFSSQLATVANVINNFVLYPILFFAAFWAMGWVTVGSEADRAPIFLGVTLAVIETVWRLRDGIFKFMPASRMKYGPSFYGAPLGIVLNPLIQGFLKKRQSGWVPVEGFYDRVFEAKREREKRYGEVYNVAEFDNGYYVRMEMPRFVPPSAAKEQLGFGDEMPDYDMRLFMDDGVLTVTGSVPDPELRKICGVSPAFPSEFKTEIELGQDAGGFQYRYADKLLEVAVLKGGG